MMNLKNLAVRSASGVVMAAVVIGALVLSPYSFLALVAFIAAGATLEFFRLVPDSRPLVFYTIFVEIVMLAVGFQVASGALEAKAWSVIFPLAAILFIAELYRKREAPIRDIAYALCAMVYIAVPLVLMINMAVSVGDGAMIYNWKPVLGFILLIWVNDVGAYIVGSLIGRRKLFEKISPKKSWEGFFGGFVFTVAAAGLMSHYSGEISVCVGMAVGAVVSLSGVAGDLVESMFKRSAGVKDSGAIMPGHGGFLDRFDAMLIAAPFAFFILEVFNS